MSFLLLKTTMCFSEVTFGQKPRDNRIVCLVLQNKVIARILHSKMRSQAPLGAQ
jgi:hypothetical protein